MLQVHGNANIIVVMSDKQQPKNAFVREQIKDKPKNYKRMWVRLGESAACGGVFALAVCLVLLFMGSMNYFHVIVTGYTVRKKEFSVMQSIGMTTRQLKKMTRMEGIFYGLIGGALVLTVGSGALGAVAVVMKRRVGYFKFVYPWRELIGVLLILGGLCVAIPEGVFRRMRKNRGNEMVF